MQGNDVNEVQRIRKVLFTKLSNFGIDGGYWFKQITGKINKLKLVDDYLAKILTDTISKRVSDTDKSMMIMLVLNLISIIVVVIIAIFFS